MREPWNNLINKYNKNGNFGKLIADILTGGDRSEVYESNINDNITGNYTIGVNYFEGSGPETATFTFKIGNNIIEKELVLPAPIGRAGESEVPYIVGTLRISLVNNQIVGEFYDYAPACQDSFEVYAAWDQNADLDLHVFEATGAHAYVLRPDGVAGKLTRSKWGAEYGP